MSSKRAEFYSTGGVLPLEYKYFKSDCTTILGKSNVFFPIILKEECIKCLIFIGCVGFCSLQRCLKANAKKTVSNDVKLSR